MRDAPRKLENSRLGPGGEFDIVRRLLARWGDLATGIGDDAAVLPAAGEGLVVSVDTSVENVHFRKEWLTYREIGYRATAAAASDLAAMASDPVGVFLSLALANDDVRGVDDIADGVGECVAAASMRILGGDLTRGPALSLALTVIGTTEHPLRRDAARDGDRLYVTGALGGPLLALRDFQNGRTPASPFRARFAHPVPRLVEARWLRDRGAHACIDISDGIIADARHLASASGVAIRLRKEDVPVMQGGTTEDALSSGEEYELLVVSREPLDTVEFEHTFGLTLTDVGSVHTGQPGVQLLADGREVAAPRGFDHFGE